MLGRGYTRLLAVLFLMPFLALSQLDLAQNNSTYTASDQGNSTPNGIVPFDPSNPKVRGLAGPDLPPWLRSATDQPPPGSDTVVPLRPIVPARPIGFPTMARAAGIIFSGTVASVARRPGNNAQPATTVAVTFHVENAIRGATPGQDLTILQWIGVWSGGQRYRVGERVFLFLYPPSRLGLTSTVGGPMGRFEIDPWGRIPLSAQHLSAFRDDPVLGGKLRVRFSDFALAVRRASGEE